MIRHFAPVPLLALVLLAGCGKPKADVEPVARPLEGMTLRLTVVDDPALAAAILRLRGEWHDQTGAELQVDETTEAKLTTADALPGDAALCASHLLGVLAERNLLQEVPQAILHDREWGEIFELLKLREAAWNSHIMAVPFGSPVFTCYYRADLLEKLGRRPPQTWNEYQKLAELLAEQKPAGDGPWCGAIEPLASGWAGLVLLARAASQAKHHDNYSTLFNVDTMEPLIAGPPFVQALENLALAAKSGPTDPLSFDPTAARAAFWRNECGMALVWPTAAINKPSGPSASSSASSEATPNTIPHKIASQLRVGFAELPGSRHVFNLSGQGWELRSDEDDSRVPLLAIAGRLGVVSATSAHGNAAFQLLLWLSSSRMDTQVSAASSATTLFRTSDLESPTHWVEQPVPAAAAVKYGEITQAAFRHEQWLGALRLPGRAEYLAALDQAVVDVLHEKSAALDALLEADAKWRKITARLGLEKQKAAYRHSLGLE